MSFHLYIILPSAARARQDKLIQLRPRVASTQGKSSFSVNSRDILKGLREVFVLLNHLSSHRSQLWVKSALQSFFCQKMCLSKRLEFTDAKIIPTAIDHDVLMSLMRHHRVHLGQQNSVLSQNYNYNQPSSSSNYPPLQVSHRVLRAACERNALTCVNQGKETQGLVQKRLQQRYNKKQHTSFWILTVAF